MRGANFQRNRFLDSTLVAWASLALATLSCLAGQHQPDTHRPHPMRPHWETNDVKNLQRKRQQPLEVFSGKKAPNRRSVPGKSD